MISLANGLSDMDTHGSHRLGYNWSHPNLAVRAKTCWCMELKAGDKANGLHLVIMGLIFM
jgi:hypothetical protein